MGLSQYEIIALCIHNVENMKGAIESLVSHWSVSVEHAVYGVYKTRCEAIVNEFTAE